MVLSITELVSHDGKQDIETIEKVWIQVNTICNIWIISISHKETNFTT